MNFHPITFFKEQWLWFRGFLEEDNLSGKTSFKRVGSAAIITAFLVAYLRIALNKKELLDIPENWAWFILGALGIVTAEKIIDAVKVIKTTKYTNGNPTP